MKVYSVVFKDGGKSYYFKSVDIFNSGDYVIVDTDKGEQFAKIIELRENIEHEELKKILRNASKEDYDKHLENLKEADIAYKHCSELILKLKLKMNVINAQYNFDRSQLLFNFTADDRIDFRDLAKKLAAKFHTRIELRQIGARDKAKEVGGIGVCGQKLCCNRFLTHMDTVSMNMAKNQNLALNPSKINGCCGRLLCCLSYEDDMYKELNKDLPIVGKKIKTNKGEGVVTNVSVLEKKYSVLIDGNKEDFYVK